MPEGENADVDFDEVPVTWEQNDVQVGDVVGWQLQGNGGHEIAISRGKEWPTLL